MSVNLSNILLSDSQNFAYYANKFTDYSQIILDLRKQILTNDYCVLPIKWLFT